MRSLRILGLAAATASAGHLSVPVSRKAFGTNPHKTVKRQDNGKSITLAALNNITGGGYYSEFEIGSPGQTISFQLDTGSSDTWMNSVESDLCQSKRLQSFYGYCQSTFDPDESETFDHVGEGDFDITYLDGRNIIGDYFEDTVTIGDANITGQRLGLALESVRVTGIMGLGFGANVAAESQYPTIVDNLVSQGLIDSPAFSLYLNDLESDEGSVLFGGIDTDKFIGELALLDLVPDVQAFNDDITSFNVKISGFDVVDPDGERIVDLHDLDSYAILDSGSTISLLPDRQVRALWDEFDVVSMENLVAPLIDCKYGSGGGGGDDDDDYIFEFRFGSKTIQVPMHEMVVDAFYDIQDDIMADDALSEYFGGWEGVCMFGIGSTADFGFFTDKFTLLGDTFLRSAYVVYDLANEQVGIAQANLNSTSSSIVEIEKGDLPDVTGVSRQGDDGSSPSPSSSSATTSTGGSPSSTGGASSTDTTTAPGATETGGDGENSSDNGDGDDDDSLGSFIGVPSTLLMSLFGAALLAL